MKISRPIYWLSAVGFLLSSCSKHPEQTSNPNNSLVGRKVEYRGMEDIVVAKGPLGKPMTTRKVSWVSTAIIERDLDDDYEVTYISYQIDPAETNGEDEDPDFAKAKQILEGILESHMGTTEILSRNRVALVPN